MVSFGAMASRQIVSSALAFPALLLVLVWAGPVATAAAQPPPTAPVEGSPPRPPTTPEPVERLGDNLLRIGKVTVDTKERQLTVAGTVNDVLTLEFIATAEGGFKAYESALSLDTDAITFNLALLLIGLDRKNATVPRFHFDPIAPRGDPVDIWVEWDEQGTRRRVPAEEIVYNFEAKKTLAPDSWVYTGSTFIAGSNAYLADLEGTLIGFVHTPAPVIEHSGTLAGNYGANRLNPALNLKPGTAVTVTVRARPAK